MFIDNFHIPFPFIFKLLVMLESSAPIDYAPFQDFLDEFMGGPVSKASF